MCGIAGGSRFYSANSISNEVLIKMLGRIKHRGPDESGIYSSENVAIGNVRLSIIDIASGKQPLCNSTGEIWIAYNGEIFNYIELREELEKKGFTFKTNSDTEVVVLLYEAYGIDFINKLNGQFAISLWDKRSKQLILIRDRVGIRPLFYTRKNKEVYFASEIKSLVEHPDIEANMSHKALSQVYTFWSSISPATVFEDIYELPPGHYMICSKDKFEVKPYWKLEFPAEGNYSNLTFGQAMEQFNDLLRDSVRIRLRADVPVAAYLSGGIDSTVTTGLIREIEPDVLNTFSIGFAEDDFDESNYQNIAANYYQTKHTGFKIKSSEIAKVFPDVVWHSESPILRSSPAPMYSLSKKVRDNNIKVVITGEGADEMLAGYNIFKESKVRRFWAKQPASKLRPLLLKRLYPYIPQIKNANSAMLKAFFGYRLSETDSPLYSHLLRWNNGRHIKRFLSNDIQAQLNNYDPIAHLENEIGNIYDKYDFLAKAQSVEIKMFMSGYLLSSQGDRMAMANSVEGRYPFLDYRLIEFCAGLNPDYKLNGLNEKHLLKKMAEGKIPNEILKRSKQAYRAPIQSSFVANDLPESIKEAFSKSKIDEQNIFDSSKVDKLMKILKSGKIASETENMALTAILSTGLLIDQFQNKKAFAQESVLENCRIINDF